MGPRAHAPEAPVLGLVVVVLSLVCVAVVEALDLLTAAGVFELLGAAFGPEATLPRDSFLRASALLHLTFGALLALVGVVLLVWTLVSTARSLAAGSEA
jgi:hypothetical protein